MRRGFAARPSPRNARVSHPFGSGSACSRLSPVKLLLLLLLLSCTCCACPSYAQQTFVVTPSACVYHEGDDPLWAQPGFDDSAWKPLPSNVSSDVVFKATLEEWRRCRLDLRPLGAVRPVAIQVSIDSAWQLFVNGREIGRFGNLDSGRYTMDVVQRRMLGDDAVGTGVLVVALRQPARRAGTSVRYKPQLPEISAAAPEVLTALTEQASLRAFHQRQLQFFCYGLIGAAGLFLLILSRVDTSQRDVLLLSLMCLSLGMLRVNELAQVFLLTYPQAVQVFVLVLGQSFMALHVVFFFALVQRPVPRTYRVLVVLFLLSLPMPMISGLVPARLTGFMMFFFSLSTPLLRTTQLLLTMSIATAGVVAFWPFWKIARPLRPLFACAVLWTSGELANSFFQLPSFRGLLDYSAVPRNYRALATVPAIVAMFFLLAQRLRRVAEERSELRSEMLAAQEIQRLLVPSMLDIEPWLRLEVAYLPAREVGGDFYFCRRSAAGQMVVIGDVSGKGLKAAMMAATVLGALRNEVRTAPAEVLSRLNAVVFAAQSGGFVTCSVLLLQLDGVVRLANAGHLSPYIAGREIAVSPGLPLGTALDATWDESVFELHDGQNLTLLSDGIVEARNAAGEIFGFERTVAVSNQTADAIAETARAFGQDDDITVLTLSLAPVGVVHA